MKSFLKEPNGVDQYKNVEVNFISGRKAVLTIFKDGKEQEKITLSDYNDRNKLIQLFEEKGFEKYPKEEMVARRKMKEEEEKEKAKKYLRPKPAVGGPGIIRGKHSDANLRGRESRRQMKAEMKAKLKHLKKARENFMVVGAPNDRKQ